MGCFLSQFTANCQPQRNNHSWIHFLCYSILFMYLLYARHETILSFKSPRGDAIYNCKIKITVSQSENNPEDAKSYWTAYILSLFCAFKLWLKSLWKLLLFLISYNHHESNTNTGKILTSLNKLTHPELWREPAKGDDAASDGLFTIAQFYVCEHEQKLLAELRVFYAS